MQMTKIQTQTISEINIGSCRRCRRLPGSASSQRGGPGYDSAAFRYSTHLFLLQILTTNIPSSSTSTNIHQLENLLGCIVPQRAWGGHIWKYSKMLDFHRVPQYEWVKEKVWDLTMRGPLPFLSVTAQFFLCKERTGRMGRGVTDSPWYSNTFQTNTRWSSKDNLYVFL